MLIGNSSRAPAISPVDELRSDQLGQLSGRTGRAYAPNVKFFGENVSLENWLADAAFCIGPPSSFGYLGIGFNCSPGDTQVVCHPAPQFHIAS